MRSRYRSRIFVVLAVLVGTMTFSVSAASAQSAFHGIGFIKGCDSPTQVGAPMNCSYTILNVVDTAHDTLLISGLTDQVHSAGGDVNSGNILGALQLVFGGTATPICVGGSGAGTAASPYIGATSCQLPFGATITTNNHSFYTVQAADFGLPNHKLTDTATLLWSDVCDGTSNNCTTVPQTNTAGSSTDVQPLASTTVTAIHNAAHQTVTAVAVGSTVHDFVTVTGQAGQPSPSGNVTIAWFLTGDCTGAAVTSAPIALGAGGTVDATAFAFTVPSAGHRSFQATYAGDATYTGSVGACEPLTVVDANIQITPATATNPVGTNHVLTCHINVNNGDGFANAPAATVCTVNIISGPGTPASQQCATVGATGSCDVTITSAVAGTSTIQATTTLAVGGVSLTRTTGDANAGDGPNATKVWIGARISIAPSATNPVGQSHTFTVTLETDTGAGFAPAAGQHVDVTLTDSSGASHTAPTGSCTGAGANTDAAGQCTITFTSNSAGQVTGHATATLNLGGQSVTVSTGSGVPNSADAVKTFVDANIQIAPLTDNNPVSTNHVLTAHVNVNSGSGFGNAPNGTVITFGLTNAGGASAAFVGANSCTTAGGTGSCSATISSTTVGTTTIKASTTVTVNGVALTRTTGDANAGDSADASKTWADATARTDILNAAGAVVTTVQAGTVVHDRVFVQRAAGTPASVPNPTGTVVFHRYTTGDCTGTPTDQSVALTQGDPSTAVTGDFAPTANISYKADYLGDANYPARSGACEPLTVTPVPQPAIAIVKNPKGQTVTSPGTARFTITVTNVGNVTLTNVTVTDPLSPNCDRTQAQIPALASMAPNAAVTYSCSRSNVTQAYDNVATATGTPPSGPNVTASDTAPVKVNKPFVPKNHPKVTSHKRPTATG